jgi:hypothetical protein
MIDPSGEFVPREEVKERVTYSTVHCCNGLPNA